MTLRIDFKILLITFKGPHGLPSEYMLELLFLYQPVRSLRSSGKNLLTVLTSVSVSCEASPV